MLAWHLKESNTGEKKHNSEKNKLKLILAFSFFTHPTMLHALEGKQKCDAFYLQFLQRGEHGKKMTSVALLVVLTAGKLEEIYIFIVFQRNLTEDGYG